MTGGATLLGANGFHVLPAAGGGPAGSNGAGSEYTGGACTFPIGAPIPVGGPIGATGGAWITGAPTAGG
jgi:hypothetical protein